MARPSLHCPWHQDNTASLKLMPSGWYCFGCRKKPTQEELEKAVGKQPELGEYRDAEPEDLTETYQYIESLGLKEHRGLKFPFDERGYYLCWPERNYYKYRLLTPGKTGKYLGAKGHSIPLFWAKKRGYPNLWIVEGEINALSISKAFESDDVCSLGSASNFNANKLAKYLTEFSRYTNITVVLDNDAAGYKALIESKAYFSQRIPFIRYILMTPDANEVLVEKGKEGLRAEMQRQNSK